MIIQVARHCPQHLVVSLWRRKSFLFAAIIITSVLIICLQYGSMGGHNDIVVRNVQPEKQEFPLGMSGSTGRNQKTLIPRRNLSALAQLGKNSRNTVDFEPGDKAVAEIKAGLSKNPNGGPDAQIQNSPQSNVRNQPNDANWDSRDRVYNKEVQQRQSGEPENRGSLYKSNSDQNQPQVWQSRQWQDGTLRGHPSPYYIPPLRLVHIDLKGAPPKLSYYKQFFAVIKDAGANGILLEYEDMFPFWGPLATASAKNAYSKEDVQSILNLAHSNNLEIIPLVQTFGHLEFVLKLQEFRNIREVDDYPQALCPSRNESFALVRNLIDQVVALHPNIKWLHIGCDEVYHLGYCSKCMRSDRDNLFLSYVARVAQYVRDKHNIIPIIWDDMLRQMSTEKLKEFQLGSLVEPMVWTYVKDIYRFVPYNVWMTYSEVFPYIWAASAFKGAFGETLTVPNIKMHLENNEAWLEVMNEQHKKFSAFRGIVITGWQRYDHLAALCELLPSGIPSLIINLLTVSQGYFNQKLFSKFHQILQCTVHQRGQVDFESDPYLWQRASSCFFPGSAVFRLTQHHSDAIKRVNEYLYDVTVHKAWLTEYNVRHNITSPMRVDEGLTDYSSIYYPLNSLVRTARDALREVFDEFTVAEWIEQNIYPYIVKMEKLWKEGMNLKKAKVWPKRPLPPLHDLKKFSVGIIEESVSRKGPA